MSKPVGIPLAGEHLHNKALVETKKFSGYQSSWKRELEKAISDKFEIETAKKQDDNSLEKRKPGDRQYLESKESIPNYLTARYDASVVNGTKQDRSSDASSKLVPGNRESVAVVRETMPHLTGMGKEFNLNLAKDFLQLHNSRVAQESARTPRVNYHSSQPKAIDIKMLADGEVVIRDYFRGERGLHDLHKLVSQLREIFGSSFGQLKINGDVLWQSASHGGKDELNIIDIVF